MREPMASELIQLAVGQFEVQKQPKTRGVEVRDVVSSSVATAAKPALARTPAHLNWMIDAVGRYPFNAYGVLAADELFFYALETQTLSLHPAFLVTPPAPASFYEPIMIHELAHQWFGNSIAPVRWQDVWLNEGHADWYQQLYTAEFFGLDLERVHAGRRTRAATSCGRSTVRWPSRRGTTSSRCSARTCTRAARSCSYALRQVVGDATFSGDRAHLGQEVQGPVGQHRAVHRAREPRVAPEPDRRSCAAGCTATRSRRCRVTRTGRRTRSRPRRRGRRAAPRSPTARALELGIYKR